MVAHYSLNIFSEIPFYELSLYIRYLQMFSFDVGYLHLFCSSFHKTHKTNTLHLFRLFLTFVFYGNTLYFCKVIIDKNNYEAKATYIPILGDRNSNGTSGVHNIIPCE